jgi:hypothetical protein
MLYSVGDKIRKLGASETYTIVASRDDPNGHSIEAGYDYLIQDEADSSHIEAVFEEDVER